MKVAIVIGSIRKGRQTDKIGYYLNTKLQERGVETDLIDLGRHSLPLFQDWSGYDEHTEATIKEIGSRLEKANAVLLITPEYHGSFSGALKNALDFYWKEFQKKPIGVATASTGKMGGINASTQLQHVILSLGAYPLPLKLLVPEVQNVFNDAGSPKIESITNSANKFLEEFLWLADAICQKQKQFALTEK